MASVQDGIAALRGNQEFNKGMRVRFRKIYRDFKTSMNPLDKYFKKEGSLFYKEYVDYVTPLTSEKIADPYQILADTGEAKVPNWRRRTNNITSRKIHVAHPRAHAKILSMSTQQLVEEYSALARAEFASVSIHMMIELLLATYKDNSLTRTTSGSPDFEQGVSGASVDAPFSKAYRHLIKDDFATDFGNTRGFISGSTKFRAPPNLVGFMDLSSALREYKKISFTNNDLNKGSGEETSTRALVIITNDGWTEWKKANRHVIGNTDFFGKSVYLGTGHIFSFQEYDFLVLPNEYLPPYTAPDSISNIVASGASGAQMNFADVHTFPAADQWESLAGNLLDARQYDTVTPANNTPGMTHNRFTEFSYAPLFHRALIVDPMAFRLTEPTQLQVPLKIYEDFTTSMEKFTFGEKSLEGTRIRDGLVREVVFTGSSYSGLFK